MRVVTHGSNVERAWAMSAGLQDGTFTFALRVPPRRAEIVDDGGGTFDGKPEYGRVPLTIMRDAMELDLPSDNILIGFAGPEYGWCASATRTAPRLSFRSARRAVQAVSAGSLPR